MTTKHDQVIKDEADAEKRHKAEKEVPVEKVKRPMMFDLSPLAADAPMPAGTVAVQASMMDPETKKVIEQLIVEIRKQVSGGGGGSGGGTATDLSSVVTDLNSLRDAIMLTNASLDADTGVATTTYAENGDPPPITTVA
jgi:hypothetical protein